MAQINAPSSTATGAVTTPAAVPSTPATTSDTQSTSKANTSPEASTAAPKAATKPTGPPPGYKLIKRRKDDGTFITIMRKMTPEELEAAGQMESPAKSTTSNAGNQGLKYKIVTVRDANGAFIRVKRPIKPGDDSAPSTVSTPTETTSNATKPAASATLAASMEQVKPGAEPGKKPQEGAGVSSNDENPKSLITTSKPPVSNDKEGPGDGNNPTPTTAKQVEPSATEEPLDMEKALSEQKEYNRQRRMRRMKGSLIRGLGTVLGSSVGNMHFDLNDDSHHGTHEDGGDIEDGDILDSDQSWSDDDDMDGDDDLDDHNDHDDHDNSSEHHDDGSNHFQFDTAGAAKGIITAAAARAASAPPKPAPAPVPNSSNKDEAANKVTYKITARELEDMDKRAAEKDLERPLRHHWTNFSFYFMASLSIILPLLFLLLALFVFLMNSKVVTSSWKVMPDVIKVGISAWPIVFAAVVAQVFKAYATWRVERGIKLIQLEQLIGSNSFGSAIKQPMVLRQLDFLSFLLLLTWCLSPFGSQALQRSYTIGSSIKQDNVTVHYLDQTHSNKVFANDWSVNTSSSLHAADNQISAIYFLATMAPVDLEKLINGSSTTSDRYDHPLLFKPENSSQFDWMPISGMGLPVVLSDSQIPDDVIQVAGEGAIYEELSFAVTSSYFQFTCGNWSVMNGTTLLSTYSGDNLAWSSSKTLAMKFTNSENKTNTINHLRFASANLNAGNLVTVDYNAWNYSFIQCGFEQKFIESNMFCRRTPPSDENHWAIDTTCVAEEVDFVPDDIVASGDMRTDLEDFADDWTAMGSPRNENKSGSASTPTEMYAQYGYVNYNIEEVNLAQNTAPEDFSEFMGQLFNTWIGVGYCPQCQSIVDNWVLNSSNQSIQDRYIPVQARREYSGDQIFIISIPWIVCFIVSTILLLLAGIISVIVESITVAPDTLGYVSSVARNSRYLHVKPTSGAMTGAERARRLADTKVMMQDVKANADVGKIALGLKSEKAVRLQADRVYR